MNLLDYLSLRPFPTPEPTETVFIAPPATGDAGSAGGDLTPDEILTLRQRIYHTRYREKERVRNNDGAFTRVLAAEILTALADGKPRTRKELSIELNRSYTGVKRNVAMLLATNRIRELTYKRLIRSEPSHGHR